MDRGVLTSFLLLLAMGLVVLYAASFYNAQDKSGGALSEVISQLQGVALGAAGGCGVSVAAAGAAGSSAVSSAEADVLLKNGDAANAVLSRREAESAIPAVFRITIQPL